MRRLASDTLIYGLGSVANQALAFLLLPLYTRYLTPADYGTLALIGAGGSILSLVAAVGIHSGLTRVYFDYESEDERAVVVFTGLAFGLVAASVVAAPLLLLSGRLAPLLLENVPQAAVYWNLAVILYSLAALNSISLAILQIHQRARAYVTCSLLGLIGSLLVSIDLVAVSGRGIRGVLEGQLFGVVVQLSLGFLASLPRLRAAWRGRPLREMLLFAVPLLPTNLAAWGLGLADRWFLQRFASLTEVGLYSLGYRFGSAFETLFVRPFSLAWAPYLFSILDDPGHRQVCARVLEYYTVIGGFLVLGLGLFGGDVIRVISDPSFFAADRVIFWIGLGCLLRGSTFITVAGIHVRKKTHCSAYAYGAGVVLNLALVWLWIPRYGMMGAAFAMVTTFGAISLALAGMAQRLHPIPYRPRRIVAVLALMTALYGLGRLVSGASLFVQLPAKLACVSAFPLLLVAVGFFEPSELARARAFASRLISGAAERREGGGAP